MILADHGSHLSNLLCCTPNFFPNACYTAANQAKPVTLVFIMVSKTLHWQLHMIDGASLLSTTVPTTGFDLKLASPTYQCLKLGSPHIYTCKCTTLVMLHKQQAASPRRTMDVVGQAFSSHFAPIIRTCVHGVQGDNL